jgi:hypothetical protein
MTTNVETEVGVRSPVVGEVLSPHAERHSPKPHSAQLQASSRVEASHFEIRIKGKVSEAVLSAFEGLHYSVAPIETVLTGPVPDQAALHGLLDRIQELGLELIEVRRLPET